MATIFNNPDRGQAAESSAGWIIGLVIAVILIILFFMYILPANRDTGGGNQNDGTTIEVPNQIKVTPSNDNTTQEPVEVEETENTNGDTTEGDNEEVDTTNQ